MDRIRQRATFTLPASPTPSSLVHPHLAVVGAVCAHWSTREAFHAGAFVTDGGVWGVLGEKGAGKSSMLAALSRAGIAILADDLLVLDGQRAFAGPRSIDLRRDAASSLALGYPLGVVGDRERWRVALEPIRPELAFHGWVALRWSEEPAIRPLRGADRLRELLVHRALRIPPRTPAALIELASLPFVELSRPRRWSSIQQAADRLLDKVSG